MGRQSARRVSAVSRGGAQAVAEIMLARGQAAAAARACTIGLRSSAITTRSGGCSFEARDQAGDQGAATRARLGYDRMLAELGVSSGGVNSSPI